MQSRPCSRSGLGHSELRNDSSAVHHRIGSQPPDARSTVLNVRPLFMLAEERAVSLTPTRNITLSEAAQHRAFRKGEEDALSSCLCSADCR